MSRPCVHSDIVEACPVCRLYRDSALHRNAWDNVPPPAAAPPAEPPAEPPRAACESLGEPITGRAADRLGLSSVRTWLPCGDGHGENGHVCKCDVANTCGACPDYRPGPTP